ncbi:MAG: C40 family peptidase [Chloroflexi bacterium]|nr:C40 family peptidase [Chloroflexota bacterium]
MRSVTRQEIVDQARQYLGVPYLHQGRNRAGLDCIGLIVLVARDLGMDVQDRADYSVDPEPERLFAGLGQHLEEVPVEQAGPGDVVLFRVRTEPQHTGILSAGPDGDPHLIHSYSSPSVARVVETVISTWAERMVAAYRFPGLVVSE